MPNFGDLCNDDHFLFKVVDTIALIYGVKGLLEFGLPRDVLEGAVVCLALPGGLIAMSILLYMYKKGDKQDIVEKTFLMVYGIFNGLAAFVSWLTWNKYMGCPNTIFNSVTLMLVTTAFASCCMLGELLYEMKFE